MTTTCTRGRFSPAPVQDSGSLHGRPFHWPRRQEGRTRLATNAISSMPQAQGQAHAHRGPLCTTAKGAEEPRASRNTLKRRDLHPRRSAGPPRSSAAPKRPRPAAAARHGAAPGAVPRPHEAAIQRIMPLQASTPLGDAPNMPQTGSTVPAHPNLVVAVNLHNIRPPNLGGSAAVRNEGPPQLPARLTHKAERVLQGEGRDARDHTGGEGVQLRAANSVQAQQEPVPLAPRKAATPEA